MKLLWFSHSAGIGGAELCMLEAVQALHASGVSSVVALPDGGPLEHALLNAGARVRHGWAPRWAGFRWGVLGRIGRTVMHPAALPGVVRLVRRETPDVVISNTLVSPAGALAARIAGVPHVWLVHEFGLREHGAALDYGRQRSLRVVGALSRRVAVVSQALRDDLCSVVPAEKLYVCTQAVEIGGRGGSPPPPPGRRAGLELLMLGQKSPGKRQEDAVRATAILRERGAEVTLRLIGGEDPRYGRLLRRLTDELGVAAHVHFAEFDPRPLARMSAADVVLNCSVREAFGRTTVEAMKLGRPVVGARSGGTAELVRHGWSGLLYPPGDWRGLADAVQGLYDDRPLLRRLGANGRAWSSETFTRDAVVRSFTALLDRICEPEKALENSPDGTA